MKEYGQKRIYGKGLRTIKKLGKPIKIIMGFTKNRKLGRKVDQADLNDLT